MSLDGSGQLSEDVQRLVIMYLDLPLHKWLGLGFHAFDNEIIELKFSMKAEFIGNQFKGIVSGGVIAAVMDVACGLFALISLWEKMGGLSDDEKMERLINVSTIDLRIDYLKPAQGSQFICRSRMLRSGKRISVAQTELFNQQDQLIAASTGAYLLG